MSAAVVVEDVWKSFRLYHERNQYLKAAVLRGRRARYEEFWALKGIEFEVPAGSTFGVIGSNGSGKSTLLKCLTGILYPEKGRLTIEGRVSALLELGAGFHPELTGRENVFINAAFLGIPRREIEKRFDAIIDFAELGRFIDEPVKHYSSGMYVRLGFAVAVNVDPDVLLVDEVLAVGDEAFAAKCLARVAEFQAEGRTIVVVSHSAAVVRQVCRRALVLDHGHLVADTDTEEAIRVLRQHLHLPPEGSEPGAHPVSGAAQPVIE